MHGTHGNIMKAVTEFYPRVALDNIRPLVLVIERSGIIADAYGATDGVAGYRTEHLVGRQVLDLMSDADRRSRRASGTPTSVARPTLPNLPHAADRAMLSGKRSGRARIVVGD